MGNVIDYLTVNQKELSDELQRVALLNNSQRKEILENRAWEFHCRDYSDCSPLDRVVLSESFSSDVLLRRRGSESKTVLVVAPYGQIGDDEKREDNYLSMVALLSTADLVSKIRTRNNYDFLFTSSQASVGKSDLIDRYVSAVGISPSLALMIDADGTEGHNVISRRYCSRVLTKKLELAMEDADFLAQLITEDGIDESVPIIAVESKNRDAHGNVELDKIAKTIGMIAYLIADQLEKAPL